MTLIGSKTLNPSGSAGGAASPSNDTSPGRRSTRGAKGRAGPRPTRRLSPHDVQVGPPSATASQPAPSLALIADAPGYFVTRDERVLTEITPHVPDGRKCAMVRLYVGGRQVKRSVAKLAREAFGGDR